VNPLRWPGRLLCALGLHTGRWIELCRWTDDHGNRRLGHARECRRCGSFSFRSQRIAAPATPSNPANRGDPNG
jgi:hypothetical protein